MTLRNGGLRSALLIGSALAMPFACVVVPASAAQHATVWTAPGEDVVLTREVRHALSDGKEVVGRRSYRLSFVREGEGWRVDGNLLEAEVEAPAELAPLAALERARKDDGLFPITLDARGMILAQGNPSDSASGDGAKALVTGALGGLSPADRSLAGDMVERISATARTKGANWPVDLFNPAPGVQSQARTMTLPDGRVGHITMTREARGGEGATLHKLERDVVTELAGTRRMNREIFTLAARR